MDPVADRLLQYLKEVGMSKSSFAEQSGINKASLSHLESGRNKASLSLVEAFHRCFPEVDLNWLITGESKIAINQQATASTLFSKSSEVNRALDAFPQDQLKETHSKTPPSSIQHAASPASEHADNVDVTPQLPSRKPETLTVLYSDGTYLEFKPRN